jgi:hypothetical protein
MKKRINVIVVEDNDYYNKLLSGVLKQRIKENRDKWDFNFKFHSYTDALDCLTKIKSGSFEESHSIAFIDYYLGSGINGTHIIKMLKNRTLNSSVVLLSQSKGVMGKSIPVSYDYFVLKDESGPALCCLCLEQYIENKFSIPLD